MGDIRQLPNLKAETREQIVKGLRLLAEAIENQIDDYDGVVFVGYYQNTEEIEPYTFNLTNSELSWIGTQLNNWALNDHFGESDET